MESLEARSTEIWKGANLKAVEESNQTEKWQTGNAPAPGLGHAFLFSPQKWGEKREREAERRGSKKAKSFSGTLAKAEAIKEIIIWLHKIFKFWHGKSHHKNQKANKKARKILWLMTKVNIVV